MRLFYCVMLLLCPYMMAAQSPVLNSISTRNKVPDIAFVNMLNYKNSNARLADFKGKMVLLDFWATWCGNCIKKFNLLDSMQRRYPDKLQVLLVNTADTRDTKDRIERFFNRQQNSAGNRFIMPVVYNDSAGNLLFPHQTIPHYVWLNAAGELMAVTDAEPVTALNLEMLVKGQRPSFTAQPANRQFNFSNRFFTEQAVHPAAIQFRSSLLPYMPGYFPASKFGKDSSNCRYTIINMPLRELLRMAYNPGPQKDRLLLQVSDSMLGRLAPVSEQTADTDRFCYEFIGPPMPLKTCLQYMQQDLQRWFGLAIKKDSLPAAGYAIRLDTARLAKYHTRAGRPANKLYDRDKKYMVNMPLGSLLSYLDGLLDKPIMGKVAYTSNLDMQLPDLVSGDMPALLQQLSVFGITLIPTTAISEQYVIYQTPKHKLL